VIWKSHESEGPPALGRSATRKKSVKFILGFMGPLQNLLEIKLKIEINPVSQKRLPKIMIHSKSEGRKKTRPFPKNLGRWNIHSH